MIYIFQLCSYEHTTNSHQMNITILIIQISFLEEGIQQSNSPKICLRSGCLRIVTKHLNHPIHHLCTKHFLNSMLLDWETKWHSILIQELLMIEVIMPIIGNVPSKLRIVDIISQGILNILLYYISIVLILQRYGMNSYWDCRSKTSIDFHSP